MNTKVINDNSGVPQKRNVVNISENGYEIIKNYCDSKKLKISKWMETILVNWIKEHEKEYRTRCIIFRGSKEDLKKLNKDSKVEINGWGGIGGIADEDFFQLSKHSLKKSEDLLLSYIVDYVKKTYPNIKITELDYMTLNESEICGN